MDASSRFLSKDALDDLFDALKQAGYDLIGPQVHQGTISYAPLDRASELPLGYSEEQAPGVYLLSDLGHGDYFAWANGPQAIKPLVFAPQETLWQAQRAGAEVSFVETHPQVKPTAVIGVKACDLAALALQDAHFMGQQYVDEHYRARRQALFLVAVNCHHPAATCFCASTGDGPGARHGYDLVMDELSEGFVIAAGSDRGQALLSQLSLPQASSGQLESARFQLDEAAGQQMRSLPEGNLYQPLMSQLDNAHWQQVGSRCLSCGNCTSVCPTCFCHSQHDQATLDGSRVEHVRLWDSCFTSGHSELHGIPVRAETGFRYRQWMTHKLGSWHEQYGRSGCVGCGRCISWCPVGIDLTEEVKAVLGEDND